MKVNGKIIKGKEEEYSILIYEGEWKDDLFDGKGILYYENGDREMGDFLNNNPKGKHVTLTSNGEVKTDINN